MGEIAAKITDSELEVMEVLWQAGEPLPLQPIRTQLERTRGWDGSTVKTLLRRLCEKGAVEVAEKRAAFYYRPLLSREEYYTYIYSPDPPGLPGERRDLVASLVGGTSSPAGTWRS